MNADLMKAIMVIWWRGKKAKEVYARLTRGCDTVCQASAHDTSPTDISIAQEKTCADVTSSIMIVTGQLNKNDQKHLEQLGKS